MNSLTKAATLCALGLSLNNKAVAITLSQQSLSQIEQEIRFQNFINERVYRQRLEEVYPSSRELLQTSQDDLDDTDVAAYSVDMQTQADEYQTLSEKELETQEKAKKMKKELAEKKKKLKKMQAQRKKEEAARKKAEELREQESKQIEQIELSAELE